MNILVTGGTGFLGSCLAKQLSGCNNITITARRRRIGYLSAEELNRFNFVQCDFRKKHHLDKILTVDQDLVVHCAGLIAFEGSGRCADNLIETNLNSTINLIETMIDKGIRKLLFCSSMTVYGIGNKVPVGECGILEPIHFYGLSKKWAEEAIISYAKRGLIDALIIRYPGLYGHQKRDGYIYNISKQLLENNDITLNTEGLKFWETINVNDACEITGKILDVWGWNKSYYIINCCYGKKIDFIDTTLKIKGIVNSKSSIKVEQPVDYLEFYLDNSKLAKLIDYDYDFERSLRRFLKKIQK